MSLNVSNLSKVKFSPVVDERKVVKYIEVTRKIKGIYPKIEYPDGSIVSDGTVFPDFDKVDKMKVN